jgi:hypothetical protein
MWLSQRQVKSVGINAAPGEDLIIKDQARKSQVQLEFVIHSQADPWRPVPSVIEQATFITAGVACL